MAGQGADTPGAGRKAGGDTDPVIESISAITFGTHDMARAVRFYEVLGFRMRYGGAQAPFSSFHVGAGYLNLILQPEERKWTWWGRVIFYVSDVDALYRKVLACGFAPHMAPSDAMWGERYFHVTDPDGHELSFARLLPDAES